MTGRHLFRALIYDTDWHSRLRCALELAREQVISPEIREVICRLDALLAAHDECACRVSVSAPVPAPLDPGYAYEQLAHFLGTDNSTLRQVESGKLELTMTLRGNRLTAEADAMEILQHALNQLQAQSCRTSSPERRKLDGA